MSIGDLIMGAMNGGMPATQLANALSGGAQQPAGGFQGAPGSPQPSGGLAQPQATQSPADMVQLYGKLINQSRAAEGFDRGLAEFLGGFKGPPGGAERLMNAVQPQQDVGSMLQNLMQIRQQQTIQSPQVAQALADQMGVPLPVAQAIIASGKYGDVEMQLAGFAGSPEIQAMNRDRIAFQKAHPGEPVPEKLTNIEKYKADTAGEVATSQQTQKDIVADKANFAPAKNAYDQMINDTKSLLAEPGLNQILGPGAALTTGKLAQEFGGTSFRNTDLQNALSKYNQVMAQQYGAGVQDFKGAGRITNQELATDMPSQSTMGTRSVTPEAFATNAKAYINKLQIKRAQLFGKAGQLNSPDLSDLEYDTMVNPIYKPGGSLYVPGQAPRLPPAEIQSPGDVAQLPSGRAYIIPKGFEGAGTIRYAE